MLDCLSTLAHGLWVCIEALLHSVEQMLMLPSWNPPLWPICGSRRWHGSRLLSLRERTRQISREDPKQLSQKEMASGNKAV
jgi:hypothetical protein